MIQKKNIKPFLTFIIISIIIDQLSKILIVNFLTPFEPPLDIVGSFLRFKLIYNPYGVFGIHFGPNVLYYVLSVVGAFILIYLGLSMKDKTAVIVFAFIIGGAIGNVIDRLRLDYVIDFIDMGIGNLRWFTYNLADAFITVGAIFLIAREIFYKKESQDEPNP
jgi:signal peptidase II